MYKKRIIIGVITIILVIILGLWVSGIIPKQIAIISASNYLKKNFPEKHYEYVYLEWDHNFGGYSIRFKDENNKIVGFIMNYNKYFPITPGQGISALEENYRIEYKNGIKDINDIYNLSIVNDYQDIRTLVGNYSKEQAQKDNCLVIDTNIYDNSLYSEFMDKYSNKKNAFIRVVQTTDEGDIIITDVLYEALNDKIHIVKDNTRDKFSTQENKTITYKTYEKTGIWNYQNSQYWVAYNGELPESTNAEYSINSDELLIITKIN